MTHSPTPSPTDTSTEPPGGSGPPAVVESTVETVWAGCSQLESSRVMVDVDEDAGEVEVSGLLVERNPCHEVTLEAVAYDADRDALSVVLGTEARSETCEECLGSLAFDARIGFEGGVPDRVFVHRADEMLATAGVERDADEADTPESSEMTDTSFRVVEGGHAEDTEGVAVRYDEGAGRVVVEGTIVGNNGCTTAELGRVEYDADSGTLDVDVETVVRREGDREACTQALVWIDYEGTFSFEGALPETVTVSHDGEEVERERNPSSDGGG